MTKLWRKTRDAQGNARLQEVDPLKLAISAPTVVFISGHLSQDAKPEIVSDGFDMLEGMLHNRPEVPVPPQIYSWSHTHSRETLFNTVAYNGLPRLAYSAAAKKLAQGTVMPLVCKDGKPLPYAAAQKNLRNLTFFGYSAGSVTPQEVYNASLRMMKKSGYKEAEARQLLNEVVLITIGPVSRPAKGQQRFTTLSLANTDDRFVRATNLILNPLRSVFSRPDRQLTIRQPSDSSLLVTAAASRRLRDRAEKSKEKGMEVELPRWRYTTSNHSFESYVNNDDRHSPVSRIVIHALVNAVNRTAKITPQQLLEPLPTLTAEQKALYRCRIEKAQAKAKPGK